MHEKAGCQRTGSCCAQRFVKPRWKCAPHVAVDAEGAWTSQTAFRVGKSSGLDRGQLGPADYEPGACVHSQIQIVLWAGHGLVRSIGRGSLQARRQRHTFGPRKPSPAAGGQLSVRAPWPFVIMANSFLSHPLGSDAKSDRRTIGSYVTRLGYADSQRPRSQT